MDASLLDPVVQVYAQVLQPIAPFTWFGLPISTLDVVAAARLCVALRQIREDIKAKHLSGKGPSAKAVSHLEPKSFVKDLSTTLTVVYGGEAIANTMLGLPPSFMLSGVGIALYGGVQAMVELLPAVPTPSIATELPLAFVDSFTRAFLLCSLIPPVVVTSALPSIGNNPWTLLLSSLMIANGGFFFTNMFSFLHPTPLSLTTPPELGPWGWTTTDIWCAPLITGLYALLTHAQPFWADAHSVLAGFLAGDSATEAKAPEALDSEVARAVCAAVLAVFFTTRTVKNFGPVLLAKSSSASHKRTPSSISTASTTQKRRITPSRAAKTKKEQ